MKKQGGIYLKVVFGVLGVFILTILLLRYIQPEAKKLQTEAAVIYEVGDGITTSGFVVRDETVLPQSSSLLTMQCKEGEWVGTGQTVAVCYTSESARTQQLQRESLTAELEQLEYAYTYATANADMATLETGIEQQMVQTAICVAQRNLSVVTDSTEKLKTYILRRYTGEDDSAALLERITQLRNQIEALGSGNTAGASVITTPQAGYFSANVDGLEGVLTPDSLQTMDAAAFESLQSQTVSGSGAVGKVITSNTWYYVTVVETQQLEGREAGDWVTVRFAYQLSQDMDMQISRIGEDENGQSLLVLKANTNVFDTTAVRQQSADVVFRTYRGLRVPKQGLYTDEEGNAGVYILEGASAAWKKVQIIRDNGDSYIVTLDKSSTSNLWPGDEIIVTTDELYDGKVVQP